MNSDAEVHSLLLPYLLQPLPGETKDTWQDVLKRNNFYTDESFEYFRMIRDEAFYDYTPFIPFSDYQGKLLQITRGRAAASEVFESIAQQYQSSLDSLYNDYLD